LFVIARWLVVPPKGDGAQAAMASNSGVTATILPKDIPHPRPA
jgi:hypothetical protein